MPSVSPSLLHYLSTKNPTLNVKNCNSGPNTKSGKTAWDLPRQIQDWADFEYQSLDSIYNGALRNVLRRQFNLHQQVQPDRTSRDIHSEANMSDIVVLWNKTIVSNGLKVAQKQIGTDLPHEKIYMCQGKQAQPPSKVPEMLGPESKGKKKNQKHRNPDWAGRKPSTVNPNEPRRKAKKPTKAKNLLPGDTKVSPKWKSANLTKGDVNKAVVKDKSWFQPVAQIYTYCVRSNARYGYIITDKELVVVRIRSLPQTGPPREEESTDKKREEQDEYRKLDPDIMAGSQELEEFVEGAPEATQALTDGVMEYKAIPWDSHIPTSQRNPEVMTVNLALWWLHMMAAESSAIEEDYVTLTDAVWDTDPGNKTPAYAVVETDSQDTAPLHETSFNSQSCVTSFESDFGGRRRPRNSQSYVTSFDSDLGGRKRTRDDDGDAEMLQMASQSKRPARGRKRGSN
jgi:hypothetical protein